ncbi:TIGR03986 family type III CRISPR-associated RAMP protein [Pseudoalteromonas rubra]|uniref:TIGR03986 family CRISPR-associated RAMP protein n=1 Tax=Pseudoalteromonas rubra TaxID=43658 RepID=A0A0F4QYL5_9GAMM|nr:TIGR03986 family CRISPR-associated RAMP protein [Pseudoalteromonas rubra]KJZ12786.1 hypothetical protein TW77_02225 [Pseudoalteromonas rubra]
MTNKTFHNPYNFIPFSKLCDTQAIESSKASLQKHRIGHERFSGLSGRINCQITVQHPVVNGNQPLPPQSLKGLDDDQKEFIKNCQIKLLAPYLRDGKHAISAASIRGMLSNLGEIITVSPPRVLEDKPMYYRNGKGWKNQAYGVIYKKAQQWYLKPLGIPPVMLDKPFKLPSALAKVFKTQSGDPLSIDRIAALRVSILDKMPKNSELVGNPAEINGWDNKVTIDHDRQLFQKTFNEHLSLSDPWIVKVHKFSKVIGHRILRKGWFDDNGDQALFIRPDYSQEEIDLVKKKNESVERFNRKIDNSTGKKRYKHSLNGFAFLERNLVAQEIPIAEDLIESYLKILNTSDEARKMRKVQAGTKGSVIDEKSIDGRILIFNVNEQGDPCHLCDSQVWRKRVGSTDNRMSDDTLYDFLPSSAGQPSSAKYKSHADEFQPFNGERKLSVMEQLFGTVADDKIDVQSKQKVTAFASRVRVYDAIASQPYQADVNNYYLLRLATGPKLPAPTMYFKPRGDKQALVTKSALNRHKHEVKGYKVYLRHKTPPELQAYHLPGVVSSVMGFQGDKRKEELAKRKECTAAPIIEQGQTLEFELEFDNLKPQELALLLTLLEPKTIRTAQDPFIHQLGQAKPYGFGAVTLKVQQLTLEDKVARYASFEPEVTTRWHPEHGNVHDWVQRAYPTQVQLWRPERLSWLLALAEPLDDVQYPQCSDGDFSFEWFVANDRSRSEEGPQFLRTDSDNRSEPLVELEKLKGKGGNNNKARHNNNQTGHNKPRNKRKPHWKDNRR